MPSLQDERREFMQLRRVSRRWKAIADTFLFRDVVAPIGRFNGLFMNREHRFLISVLRGGYEDLVRNMHIELGLNDDVFLLWANNYNRKNSDEDDDYVSDDDYNYSDNDHNCSDNDSDASEYDDDDAHDDYDSPDNNSRNDTELNLKFNAAGLLAYTNLVCDLLTQHSCRCLRLMIEVRYADASYKSEASSGIIVNKVLDACQSLPTNCKVEFMISSSNSSVPKACYEEWFSTGIPESLSSKLSSLAITIFSSQVLSTAFFASLYRTKKFQLITEPGMSWNETELAEIAIGIEFMPAIEDLSLEYIPISSYPKTLRRLGITALSDFSPGRDFFINLHQLDALEDLRISMIPIRDNEPQSSLSRIDLWQSSQGLPSTLRILKIRAYKYFELFENVCTTILHDSPFLEEITFNGVNLNNEVVLNSATPSFQSISVNTYPMELIDIHELVTDID